MNTAEIRQINPEQGDRISPVNFSITVALPGGRQITAQTSYWPVEGKNPNGLLDEVTEALERQRYKYEVGVVEGESDTLNFEIKEHEEKMATAESEINRLDEETTKKIAGFTTAILADTANYNVEYDRVQGEYEKDGRRTFDPNLPGIQNKLRPFAGKITEAKEGILKAEEEKTSGHKNHKANMAHFQHHLDALIAKRDARLKLIG